MSTYVIIISSETTTLGGIIILSALYFVLFSLLLYAWGHTNVPGQPFNLWKFYLVQLAAIGAMVSVGAPIAVYLVVFAVLTLLMGAHFVVSSSMSESFSHGPYMFVTFIGSALWYVVTAFLLQSPTEAIAALIVLVIAIPCTYTKVGRRFVSWIDPYHHTS